MTQMISEVIIIPSYSEVEALPAFLVELIPILPITTSIIICDDSPEHEFEVLKKKIIKIENQNINISYLHSNSKAGRGAAVKRGLEFARKEYKECRYFLECDADGSHRPEDVIQVLKGNESIDLVIGSRYLEQSLISNWPKSRRAFSRILNWTIPKVLRINVKDVTNGLRRYSANATAVILQKESQNSGFTYLSEQALIVSRAQMSILEVPIHFIDRIHGESTVTYREIINSIKGIFKLVPMSR
jgi:dolichol-phosphate mannosyltransferase